MGKSWENHKGCSMPYIIRVDIWNMKEFHIGFSPIQNMIIVDFAYLLNFQMVYCKCG